jgi:excisionase family DNA binding protein
VELLLSTREGARRLGCGKTKLFGLLRTGQIQAVRFGGRTMIPTTELERFASTLPRRRLPRAEAASTEIASMADDGPNASGGQSGERA